MTVDTETLKINKFVIRLFDHHGVVGVVTLLVVLLQRWLGQVDRGGLGRAAGQVRVRGHRACHPTVQTIINITHCNPDETY